MYTCNDSGQKAHATNSTKKKMAGEVRILTVVKLINFGRNRGDS